ncbi:MAG: hypothetical protein AAB846_00370, partial [Patescibacteria group bacterium]
MTGPESTNLEGQQKEAPIPAGLQENSSEALGNPEQGLPFNPEVQPEQGPSEIDWPRRVRLTEVVGDTKNLKWVTGVARDTEDTKWVMREGPQGALQEAEGAEPQQEVEQKVAREIEEAFDRMEKIGGEDERNTRFEKITSALSKLRGVKIFGKDIQSFLVGMAAGGSLRFATKMALGGGAGIGLSAVAGGVSGGRMAGMRAYSGGKKRLQG